MRLGYRAAPTRLGFESGILGLNRGAAAHGSETRATREGAQASSLLSIESRAMNRFRMVQARHGTIRLHKQKGPAVRPGQ